MRIQTDRRSIEVGLEPEAAGRLAQRLASLRDLQLELARDFARIAGSLHFAAEGCASIVEYGMKLGYSADETRLFTRLGKALEAEPELEARIRRGEIHVEAAAVIGRVLGRPELLFPDDDWVSAAASETLRDLRSRVRRREELYAHGEPGFVTLQVDVPPKTRESFGRAREVASQKAGQPLTDGQTLGRVVAYYLDHNDPLRQKGGKRRIGPTSERPGDRYIPADVRRAVMKRAGGRCEVEGCHHAVHLELAHRIPHATGSAREVTDLAVLCHRHHVLYDAGKIPWPVALGDAHKASGTGDPPEGAARRASGGASTVRDPLAAYKPSRPPPRQAPARASPPPRKPPCRYAFRPGTRAGRPTTTRA